MSRRLLSRRKHTDQGLQPALAVAQPSPVAPLPQLLQQLQDNLGNERVQRLCFDGPEDAHELHLFHLLSLAQESGLHFGAYLPWNAPPSWTAAVQPYFDVCWWEQAGGDGPQESQPGAGQLARDARGPVDAQTGAELGEVDQAVRRSGAGRRLKPEEQAVVARVHGRTLPKLRVHEGPTARRAARAVHARAFAHGQDVFLGEHLDVSRPEGAELLVHEATHVLQADEGRLPRGGGPGLSVSAPSDPHEREASAMGRQARQAAASGDPWGLDRLDIGDPAARALIGVLRDSLPVPPPAPPAQVLKRALAIVLAERLQRQGPEPDADLQVQQGADDPLLLRQWLQAAGPPSELELRAVQHSFAPYPTLAHDLSGIVTEMMPAASAPASSAAALVSRDPPTEGGDESCEDESESTIPSGPPRFAVEQEVWAQVEPGRWRRAVITALREPEEEELERRELETLFGFSYEGQEEDDGWLYVISLEELDACVSEQLFSGDLHDAEEQGQPAPTLPELIDDGAENEPDEAQLDALEEEPAQEEDEAEVEAEECTEEEGQSSGDEGEGGEGELGGEPGFPALPPGDGADLSVDPGLDAPEIAAADAVCEDEALVSEDLGYSPVDLIDESQSSVDDMFSTWEDEAYGVCEVADEAVSQADAVVSSSQDELAASSSELQDQISSAGDASADSALDVSSTAADQVDEAAATAQATIQDLSLAQATEIDSLAQAIEAEVQANQGAYAAEIDAAICSERDALRERLDGAILALTQQADAEEAEAREAGRDYSGSVSAAPAEAERLAVGFTNAKVKKRYARALRRIADAAIEDLEAQLGDPSALLSGELHAPTVTELWPAMEPHQQQVEDNRERNQAEAQAAREEYREITSREGAAQAEQARETEAVASETVDASEEAADQSLEAVQNEDERLANQVSQVTDEQRQQAQADMQSFLSQLAGPEQQVGPGAAQWTALVQAHEQSLVQQEQQTAAGLAEASESRLDEASGYAEGVCEDAEDAASTLMESQAADTQAFTEGVTESAVQTNVHVEDLTTLSAETALEVYEQARARGEEAMALLMEDTQTFLELRVRQNVATYSQQVDAQMAEMMSHMDGELQNATATARSEERSDRNRRQDDCWAGVDYTWGTDEERLMRGVSGVNKVRGYALQHEFEMQHGEPLEQAIIDDTSGSLKSSLLAWIEGDERTAAIEAMNYAQDGIFGPDTDTIEVALRGVSEEGRRSLSGDQEFHRAQERMMAQYLPGDYANPDRDTLAVLSDMGQSRESALLMADAIRMYDTMDHPGTDEADAYRILGLRDAEGNEQLARAYAQYSYEHRMLTQSELNSGASRDWDALSREEQDRLAGSSLSDEIEDEFSRYEQDRAEALLAGNAGAAAAAQLEGAASWSNDMDEAQRAMEAVNRGRNGGWLDQAEHAERRGEFMATTATYQEDELSREERREFIAGHNTRERRDEAASDWDDNATTTRQYIADEFGDGTITGDTDASRDERGWGDDGEVDERILLDMFDRGEADERDLMDRGVDCAGTREIHVRQALSQIAGLTDVNVRLARLNELGAYCWGWFDQSISEGWITQYYVDNYARRSSSGMGGLPPYMDELEQSNPSLRRNIQGVMMALDMETDGGEQFDFELLVVQATVRQNNATDLYSYAEQMFNSMRIDEDPEDQAAVDAMIQRTPEQAGAIVEQYRADRESNGDEAEGQASLSCDDQLRAHWGIVQRLYLAGAGDWYDDDGWLSMAPGQSEPTQDVTRKWEEFQEACRRLDVAKSDLDEHQSGLVAGITLVVGIVAAIAIAVVSLGSASAASAAIIGACIALASGAITVTVNLAIRGDRYGGEQMLIDIGQAIADAVLNVVTLGVARMRSISALISRLTMVDDAMRLGQAIQQTVINRMLVEAVKSVPSTIKDLLCNENFWRGDSWDQLATNMLLNTFANTMGGTVSGNAQWMAGIDASVDSLNRILAQVSDNFFNTLLDPRNWENEDFGWQLLRAVGEGIVAGLSANSLRSWAVSRVNSKVSGGRSTMTETDWARIGALNEADRAYILAELAPVHGSTLSEVNPDLHSQLFPGGESDSPTSTSDEPEQLSLDLGDEPGASTPDVDDSGQYLLPLGDEPNMSIPDDDASSTPVDDPDQLSLDFGDEPNMSSLDEPQQLSLGLGDEPGMSIPGADADGQYLLPLGDEPAVSSADAGDDGPGTSAPVADDDGQYLLPLGDEPNMSMADDPDQLSLDFGDEPDMSRAGDPDQLSLPLDDAGSTPVDGDAVSTSDGVDRQPTLVDLNSASEAELAQLTQIGEARAEAIVAEREANGPFTSLADLSRVHGIGDGIVGLNEGRVSTEHVDLNTANADALSTLDNVSPDLAAAIVAEREANGPFYGPDDMARRVNGVGGATVDRNRARMSASGVEQGTGGPVVDINTASAAQLAALDDIGGTLAARIVAEREANGPFRSAADLTRVDGIGDGTVELNSGRIRASAVETDSADPVSAPLVQPDGDDGADITDVPDAHDRSEVTPPPDADTDADPTLAPQVDDGARTTTDGSDADAPAAVDEASTPTRDPEQVEQALADREASGGQEGVIEHVRAGDTPEEQARRLQLMDDYEAIMRMDPREMTSEQRDTVLRAQAELDQSFQSADTMRKVIPIDSIGAYLNDGREHVGGAVGDARNTDGLSAAQIVERLGLDYTDSDGNQPYLTRDAEGNLVPVNELVFLDMDITPEMRDQAQIPVDPSLAEHARNSDDPAIAALVENDRLLGGADQGVQDVDGARDPNNPRTGTGGTAAADANLPDAPVRANQELEIPTNHPAGQHGAEIPDGARMVYRGPDGQDVVIARMERADNGSANWVVNQDLPPALQTRLLGEAASDPASPVSSSDPVVAGDAGDADRPPDTSVQAETPADQAQESSSLGDWFRNQVGDWRNVGLGGQNKDVGAGRMMTEDAPELSENPELYEQEVEEGTQELEEIFGQEGAQVRAGSGSTARYTVVDGTVTVSVPPGRSPAAVTADVRSQIRYEHRWISAEAEQVFEGPVRVERVFASGCDYSVSDDGDVTVSIPYGEDLASVQQRLIEIRDARATDTP